MRILLLLFVGGSIVFAQKDDVTNKYKVSVIEPTKLAAFRTATSKVDEAARRLKAAEEEFLAAVKERNSARNLIGAPNEDGACTPYMSLGYGRAVKHAEIRGEYLVEWESTDYCSSYSVLTGGMYNGDATSIIVPSTTTSVQPIVFDGRGTAFTRK